MTPAGTAIHPAALCESDDVGPGTRIWAFAHVLPGASIGRDCNICDHAFVEGGVSIGDRVTVKNGVLLFTGVTVGDDVFLGPGVIFTNDLVPRRRHPKRPDELLPTRIGQGATLGAGVVVVCGTDIGACAFVGAGAVVTRDVPAHALIVGNPASQIGWVCSCGERLHAGLVCPDCGDGHRLISESAGLSKSDISEHNTVVQFRTSAASGLPQPDPTSSKDQGQSVGPDWPSR